MKKHYARALALRLCALCAAMLMAVLLVSPVLAAQADGEPTSPTDAGEVTSSDPTYMALLEDSGILSGTDVQMLRFAAERDRIAPINYNEDLYFDTWSVLMRVHRNRSIDIIENFDVYFNEEMHGMTRTLPAYSSAEAFEIRGMEVVGSDYHYSGDTIYIGSSDVTVRGLQHYTIKYTIANFEDNYNGYDRLYRDIVGSEVQNTVYNVIGCVVLDEGMTFDKVNIYAGSYGSTGNDYVTQYASGNKLLIYSTRELGSYRAVTLDAELPDGSFSEPALLQPDYIVDNLDVKASIDKYGYMHVDESYDVSLVQNSTTGFYRELPMSDDSRMETNVEHLTISKNGQDPVSSRDNYSVGCLLDPAEGDTAHIDVSYDVKCLVRTDASDDRIVLPLITYTDAMCKYKNVSFELKTPLDLDSQLDHAGVYTGNYSSYASYESDIINALYRFDTSTSGDTIISKLEGTEMPIGETATAEFRFVKGALERKTLVTDYILSILGLLGIGGLGAASLAKKSGEKQLTPSVQYYPPAGLNPAEIGYIIDNECENRDVTSLIYYWASKGFLTIEMPGKGSGFTLHKIKPLSSDHRDYERVLFNKMFSLGSGESVKDSQLSTKLYSDVNTAASKVKHVFTGNQRFFTPASSTLSHLMPIAVPVIVWIGTIIAGQVWGSPDSSIMAFAIGGIAGAIVAFMQRRSYIRQYKDKAGSKVFGNIVRIIVLAIPFLMMLACGGGAVSYITGVILAVLVLVNALVSPKLLARTDFYTDLLGLVVGFKEFLETAEKDRLKMLLDQNPSYYYDILPYAQVLGVSKQWASRFDGLAMQAPTWFYGPSVTPYTFNSMLDRNMTRMNNSMTSMPEASGGGGGFSGGSFGGGFSGGGGGFSGGGGGGGAGGW